MKIKLFKNEHPWINFHQFLLLGFFVILLISGIFSCALPAIDSPEIQNEPLQYEETKAASSSTSYILSWTVPADNAKYRYYYSKLYVSINGGSYQPMTKVNQYGYTEEITVNGSGAKTYGLVMRPEDLAVRRFLIQIYAREYYYTCLWYKKWLTGPKYISSDYFSLCYSPKYYPYYWNKTDQQRNSDNCYTYACNVDNADTSPPNPYNSSPFTETALRNKAASQGLMYVGKGSIPIPPLGKAVVALILIKNTSTTFSGYHWFRLDRNGYWSHKHGTDFATNLDGKNNTDGTTIINPKSANWTFRKYNPSTSTNPNPTPSYTAYDYFGGFFLTGSGSTSGAQNAGTANLN